MRKIPSTVTDPAIIENLNILATKIEEKMNRINTIRDAMKKNGPGDAELKALKQISAEIEQLDQKWKSLV
jgi:hypothetical protein